MSRRVLQSIASSYGISRQAVSQTLHNLLEKVDVELYKMFIHSRDNNVKIEMHINYFLSPNNTVHVTCSEFSISYVVFKKEINKMFQINKKKATLAQNKLDKEKSLNFKHGCKKRVDLRYAHYIIENKVSISNTAKYFGVSYPTVYRNLRSIKKYYPELYIKAVEILKI